MAAPPKNAIALWRAHGRAKLLRLIHRIVASAGALSALAFLPGLILVSIFDITTRRFLQSGSTPLQELGWHFFFACVMFGIGYTYIRDRHVRVDILRERMSPHARARLEQVLIAAFLLPLSLILVWFGARMAWLSFVQGEGSQAALGLSSRWIVKSALPIGALLLFLAGCYRLAHPSGPGQDES